MPKYHPVPRGPKMSQHAEMRMKERFPGVNWEYEYERSHPWGVRVGRGVCMLSPAGIVFMVESGVIRTVMSKEMAISEHQALCPSVYEKSHARALAVDIMDKQRITRSKQENDRRNTAIESKLKSEAEIKEEKMRAAREIAERHAWADHERGLDYGTTRSHRSDDANQAGLGNKYKKMIETIYGQTRVKLRMRPAIEPHPLGEPEEGT